MSAEVMAREAQESPAFRRGEEVKAPKVGVGGFGRCGSSMLMQMLAAGGIPPAPGAAPGSGEHASLSEALSSAAPGAAVKLLDLRLAVNLGQCTAPTGAWALIWMDRDPRWQAESFRKFVRWAMGMRMTVSDTRTFRESLIHDRDLSVEWIRGLGHPVLALSFEEVLADPRSAAGRVAAFLPWADLDAHRMAEVVHVRSPRTRPDMSVEEAAS